MKIDMPLNKETKTEIISVIKKVMINSYANIAIY